PRLRVSCRDRSFEAPKPSGALSDQEPRSIGAFRRPLRTGFPSPSALPYARPRPSPSSPSQRAFGAGITTATGRPGEGWPEKREYGSFGFTPGGQHRPRPSPTMSRPPVRVFLSRAPVLV